MYFPETVVIPEAYSVDGPTEFAPYSQYNYIVPRYDSMSVEEQCAPTQMSHEFADVVPPRFLPTPVFTPFPSQDIAQQSLPPYPNQYANLNQYGIPGQHPPPHLPFHYGNPCNFLPQHHFPGYPNNSPNHPAYPFDPFYQTQPQPPFYTGGRLPPAAQCGDFQQFLPTIDPAMLQKVKPNPVGNRMSAQLESCSKRNLEEVVITPPQFFLDDLWPPEYAPIGVPPNIFTKLIENRVWNPERDCFFSGPDSYSENDMARWLNALGGMIGHFNGNFKPKRMWFPNFWNMPSIGSNALRKPDLMLLDSDATFRVSWPMIYAFAEVGGGPNFPKCMISSISNKSYVMFMKQHDRRFVPALCFDGKGMFSVVITDRHGQITMSPMSLLRGRANAIILMKILCFLMYGSVEHTGLDVTMSRGPDAKVRKIFVNQRPYDVYRKIYLLESLISRGTVIWIAIGLDRQFYIIKDSWIQENRVESEIQHLEKLKDDSVLGKRVPRLVDGEDVKVYGTVDSTGRYRRDIGGLADQKIHRRLVLSPIGISIIEFNSMREFVLAIIDIVEGMLLDKIRGSESDTRVILVLQRLHQEHKILHRDISLNNIMLVRDNDGNFECGLLIDFDYAALIRDDGGFSDGMRTVCPLHLFYISPELTHIFGLLGNPSIYGD
jgi:Fungal protein kinase